MDLYDRAFEMGVNAVHRVNITAPKDGYLSMYGMGGKRYLIQSLGFSTGSESVWITGYGPLKSGGWSTTLSRNEIGSLSDVPPEMLIAVALHFLDPFSHRARPTEPELSGH